MKAPQTSGKKQFERHPTGWALLVCSRVIDLGTHFNQKKQKEERKVSIFFESSKLMSEGDFAGQPFLLMATFNYSMYKNSMLCGFIEDWLGKKFEDQDEADNFDLSSLLTRKAFGNVVHNGEFDNIQPIGPVPEGMTAPEIKGKTILIDQASLDPKEVEKLSDKMKERVMSSQEQSAAQTQHVAGGVASDADSYNQIVTKSDAPPAGDFDDDIPFAQYGFRTVI